MNPAEKRKNTLINIIYFAFFATIYVLFIKYALGLVFPFIAAFLIAMGLQKPIKFLAKKTKTNEKFWAILLDILIVLVIIGLVVFLGYKIGVEFKGLVSYISSKAEDYPIFVQSLKTRVFRFVNKLPKSVILSVKDALLDAFDKLQNFGATASDVPSAEPSVAVSKGAGFDFSILATPLSGIVNTAKKIPAVVAAMLMGVIACFFLTADYDSFIEVIKKLLTKSGKEKLARAKHATFDVLGKWIKSYAMILFITFCEVTVGLSILKLCGAYEGGYILAIGIGTALLDILPVFGTGTVLVPWCIISLLSHKIGLGVGLIIMYGMITVIRQVIEPRLVSKNVDMHPVITLMSMYIGIQVFGVLGILILPITVVVVKTLNEEGVIHLWGESKTE